MNIYRLHHPNKAYTLLRLAVPLSNDLLTDFAHDIGATLNRRLSVTIPLSKEQRDREHAASLTAQYSHKAFKAKQPSIWAAERDQLIRAILSFKTPSWPSLNLHITKNGI